MRGFQSGVIGKVKQSEDDHQHDWNDDHETFASTLLVFILTAPVDVVARRQLHLTPDFWTSLVDEAAYIASTHVEQNGAAQQAIFAGDHCRPYDGTNVSELREGNWRTGRRGDRNLSQSPRALPIFRRITNAYREATATFDRHGEVSLADTFFYSVLYCPNIDRISSRCLPIDLNINLGSAADLFRIDINRARYSLYYISDTS